MKKSIIILVAIIAWLIPYSQSALNNIIAHDTPEVSLYSKPITVPNNINNLPINIQANKSYAQYPNSIVFSGNVHIEQGNRQLNADQVKLEQKFFQNQPNPIRTVTATGNVNYSDQYIKLQGSNAWSNLNNNDTNVWKANYEFLGYQGRGTTDIIKTRSQNRYTILENGTFTTCLPGDNSWTLAGSKIIQDNQEEVAKIWDAYFKIGSLPVFYSPYIQLPTGKKRRSGFLMPHFKYSKNHGIEFSFPWYWNIAPWIDVTITPHYIGDYSLQLQNELRYLNVLGRGLIEFNWINKNKKYVYNSLNQNSNAILGDHKKHWLFYWNHNGILHQIWNINIDYTKVSNPYYFNDIEYNHGLSTKGYATQKICMGYNEYNWNTSLSIIKFQVFGISDFSNSYFAEPQLDLNYYKNNIGPFQLHLYSQMVKFTNQNNHYPQANRYHFEPTLYIPWHTDWININTEIKLLATRYKQIIPKSYYIMNPSSINLHTFVNRIIPEFKIDGKMIFNRNINCIGKYTQTLEPRVQYLYIPYRDQSNISIYDSTPLQVDYNSLFRDRIYSGLDRIPAANQISTGLTTHIYDDASVEYFNASLGQIYYLNSWCTSTEYLCKKTNQKNGNIVLASNAYWRINDNWGIRNDLQYDTYLHNLSLGNVVIEYRKNTKTIIQFNYRYASPKYVTTVIPQYHYKNLDNKGISQVGAIGNIPVTKNLALIGEYYYNTTSNKTVNSLIGLQYKTCCWSIGVNYEHKITPWDISSFKPIIQYDNKLSFTFALRGLESLYNIGAVNIPYKEMMFCKKSF
ncbi:LPS assembly protein LptD [Candidatus Profftia sp. (ex Adelges kitamiensis)]|uniref:LPS assembly protein LptD n=1 Tax=Candidatus Profftia sp. (ex Adelges kitamiensis) TaxID=2864218 RepID=UPI001CE29577|nr:LPS assembly protein LptD [Candidatus Profftia sp. (ex Adelges kitamiensis)]